MTALRIRSQNSINMRYRLMYKKLTQKRINYLNLSIAILALIFSLPSVVNQVRQFHYDSERNLVTEVVYFAPKSLDISQYLVGDECWGSNVSIRTDAYRCVMKNQIHDPCFYSEIFVGSESLYFACPESELQSTNDLYITIQQEDFRRNDFKTSRPIDLSSDLPWLMYIDGVACRSSSGMLSMAYGGKGSMYSCDSDSFISVTSGEVDNKKFYFECKRKNESIFERCFSDRVVY